MNDPDLDIFPAFFMPALCFYMVSSWFYNLYLLFNCDFESHFKDELIYLIGVVIPPLAGITIWL